MLNNAAKAAAAAAAGKKVGGSKIQQMLAGREDITDKVELSPVAKLLQQSQAQQNNKPEPFTEQEWFIKAKVAQLRSQIEIYSNLPGLDPSGAMMEALTKEVNELVKKQQAAIKAVDEKAKAAQAKADEKAKADALARAIPDVDTLLKRARLGAKGDFVPSYESTIKVDEAKEKAVQEMLKKIGAKVNTTA